MIQGSFSINSSVNSLIWEQFNASSIPEAAFHTVLKGDFAGGFYLHPRLPMTQSDIYFSDEDNGIIVMLSGYVYNRPELYLLCNLASQVSDPELVALLFLKEGPDFIKKINGDLSVFIGLPEKKEAYLFRDHLGVRPLAWTVYRNTLFFSTDIMQLCRVFSEGEPIRKGYLLAYFKYIDYTLTINDKVKKLLPGHYLHYSVNGIDIIRYWKPEETKTDKRLTYERIISDLKSLVMDAVVIRCDKRLNAGSHVSSGIDSGLVSALARQEYRQQEIFYGFSWSPAVFSCSNVKFDERALVIKSCEMNNIKPLFSEMREIDFQRFVSSLSDNYGLFSEYFTIEQAVQCNANLIFSGWGGDEFISTGNRGIEQDLLSGLNLSTFFRRNPVRNLKAFVRKQLFFVIYPALGILDRGTINAFRDDARYIKKPFKRSDRKALRNFYFHTSRRKLHLGLLRFYHIQERCESWMINGFRKGIEYRYPLLDRRIIEYMLKVPSEILVKTDIFRPILREISEGILSDAVRLNKDKSDPVYWEWMDELFKNSARHYMLEIDDWKTNPELDFVDFDLLNEDISRFNKGAEDINQKVLFRGLVYTKGVHEFTKTYRNVTSERL